MGHSDFRFWSATDPLQSMNGWISRMVRATLQISWPAIMHKSVSNYVLADAATAGLPERLVNLFADNSRIMLLYAAAPDNNGVGQVLHIFRPEDPKYQGGLDSIRFWYACAVTMLQRVVQAEEAAEAVTEKKSEDAAKASAALSHFTADLANPMHTTKNDKLHSKYESWLGEVFAARDADDVPLTGVFRKIHARIGQHVTKERAPLATLEDVSDHTTDHVVAESHTNIQALRDAWDSKRKDPESLIELSARMFGLGATFTADLWTSAWQRAKDPAPMPQLRLGSVTGYDVYITRLTAHAEKGKALGWW